MTLGMRRIQEQKENVIKLKKTWNGNKDMKPWCLILNFICFIKQNCIDFLTSHSFEHLWNLLRNFLNLLTTTSRLSCKTCCGNGLGKQLQDQLKTFFHLIWCHNGTIGWASYMPFSAQCLNMLFALHNNLVPWTCILQLPVHAEHSNCLFWK